MIISDFKYVYNKYFRESNLYKIYVRLTKQSPEVHLKTTIISSSTSLSSPHYASKHVTAVAGRCLIPAGAMKKEAKLQLSNMSWC